MATTKISGVVLKESNMGDFDKMLTMLTPGIGKISCAISTPPNTQLAKSPNKYFFILTPKFKNI